MAIQARTEFASALNQVCSERGIEPEVVIDSIKHAILAAYRKDYGEPENIIVDLNPETGEVALTKNKKNITPSGFGRIAAQTAKQVILQKIREAEKNAVLSEYSSKIGTIISGLIQRISGPIVTVSLGKAEAIMPPGEQSQNEKYMVNQRLKFYVVGIKEGNRGEEIIVSRAANGLLEGLFKQEVPEIASGAVEVKAIAREAGSRSKIAVFSNQMGVDPVGSCVGQKGVRVQAVINELGDEKIDVISYQEDPVEFIKAALSPAKDLTVKIAEKEKTADVTVADDQLSLAIGRDGQNVRLAAKLTGFKIDIKGKSGTPKEVEEKERKAQEEAKIALGVEKGTAEKETKSKDTGKSNRPADDQTQAGDQSKKGLQDKTQDKKELPAKEEPKKLKAPEKSKSEDSTPAGNQDEKQSSDDGKTT
ncbi:transcription termination factor NusA [Candidatus Curtissbacteria bacterium RIFCSPHIGHO2_02_FULL_42_15]|uniref:Transcription termination/antitermination protein NusA n=1 Tax=Candidatus Curtissbacteria bacterium RIFCSPHIGHO2_02_FULL_42_15 TaxID=1797716 RepID=A0A1F5GJU6_9BACT|nr:MAG: transcription termination factor NusA [Candidatus Curtissbacteria bacterium RIFCSPHIGHO2_02_FULL_42_15]